MNGATHTFFSPFFFFKVTNIANIHWFEMHNGEILHGMFECAWQY